MKFCPYWKNEVYSTIVCSHPLSFSVSLHKKMLKWLFNGQLGQAIQIVHHWLLEENKLFTIKTDQTTDRWKAETIWSVSFCIFGVVTRKLTDELINITSFTTSIMQISLHQLKHWARCNHINVGISLSLLRWWWSVMVVMTQSSSYCPHNVPIYNQMNSHQGFCYCYDQDKLISFVWFLST